MKVLDKAGNELRPGDLIIYGHLLGRCAALQFGKVLGFKGRDEKLSSIRVQGVGEGWHTASNSLVPRLLNPGSLSYPGRVLRVDQYQVPEDVRALLATVQVP